MTLRDRTALVTETFALLERQWPTCDAQAVVDMTCYHLARYHGLVVTPNEVLNALAAAAQPVESP